MVTMYNIAGRQIGSHYLAIAVLGTVGGVVTLATRGGGKKTVAKGPPIDAKSPDEERFIQDFLRSAEGGETKGNNVDATKKDAGR